MDLFKSIFQVGSQYVMIVDITELNLKKIKDYNYYFYSSIIYCLCIKKLCSRYSAVWDTAEHFVSTIIY